GVRNNPIFFTVSLGMCGCGDCSTLTPVPLKKCLLTWCACIVCISLSGQKRINYTRMFQVSLLPGISSSGMHPGGYHNYFSLNLTAGYAGSTRLLGLALISNADEESTSGLQIAGLANLTGVNAFAGMQRKEREEK